MRESQSKRISEWDSSASAYLHVYFLLLHFFLFIVILLRTGMSDTATNGKRRRLQILLLLSIILFYSSNDFQFYYLTIKRYGDSRKYNENSGYSRYLFGHRKIQGNPVEVARRLHALGQFALLPRCHRPAWHILSVCCAATARTQDWRTRVI